MKNQSANQQFVRDHIDHTHYREIYCPLSKENILTLKESRILRERKMRIRRELHNRICDKIILL